MTNKMKTLLKVLFVTLTLSMLLVPFTASAFNFAVSPLLKEFDETQALPGAELRGTIKITNNDTKAQFFEPEVADFYYDEEGNMVFYEEDAVPNANYSMKAWVTPQTDIFKLEPNESREVDYLVTVPADAVAGGHYGVVFFRSQADPEAIGGTGVATSGRLGTLLLVTVPGDVTKSAKLTSFQVGVADDKGNLIPKTEFEAAPVSFSFSIENTGNAYFEPKGQLHVKGFNIDEDVALESLKAFPGVPRTFVQTLETEKMMFGKYIATLNLVDGDGNALPAMTVTFTVYQWKVVIFWGVVVIIVLVVLIGAIKKLSGMSKKGKK